MVVTGGTTEGVPSPAMAAKRAICVTRTWLIIFLVLFWLTHSLSFYFLLLSLSMSSYFLFTSPTAGVPESSKSSAKMFMIMGKFVVYNISFYQGISRKLYILHWMGDVFSLYPPAQRFYRITMSLKRPFVRKGT